MKDKFTLANRQCVRKNLAKCGNFLAFWDIFRAFYVKSEKMMSKLLLYPHIRIIWQQRRILLSLRKKNAGDH